MPRASASSAVCIEPPRNRDSTTTTASAKPAMIRLRAGKRHASGGVPSGASDKIRPACSTRRCRSAWRRG